MTRLGVGAPNAQPLDGLFDWTVLLAIFASFAISSLALAALGVNYAVAGGGALQKLHPASWIFVIALVMNVLRQRDIGSYLARLPARFPGAALFAAMWALLIAAAVAVQRAPVMPLVDTFLPALAILVLYDEMDARAQRNARVILHAIMFANASLGIVEQLSGFRLTPFVAGGELILHDPRSTALLGHPLLNAGTTGGYILMLFFGGEAILPAPIRLPMMALQMAAMVPFGGRTAIVTTLAILAAGSLPTLLGVLNGRRFDRRAGLCVAIAAPVLVAIGAAALASGYLTILLDRFVADDGSAKARLLAFELFQSFSLEDLLLGPDPSRLASLQNTLGIQYGIENSWLGFLFQYGGLITLFFVIGFAALLDDFRRRARARALVLILFFIVQVSSAASISVKSFSFNQFAILLLVMFHRGGAISVLSRESRAMPPGAPVRLTSA